MVPGTNDLSAPTSDDPIQTALKVADEEVALGGSRLGNQLPSTKNGNPLRSDRPDDPDKGSVPIKLDVNRLVPDQPRNDGVTRRQRQADPQTCDQEQLH